MLITSFDRKKLAVSLAIPLLAGGIASFLNYGAFRSFESISKPAFAPPQILFPIVWTILYLLMGVSFYLVWTSSSEQKKTPAYLVYGLQLAANFAWTFLFFGAEQYYAAWIELLVLIALVIGMIFTFYPISRAAAYLQIPYFVWVVFASFLNYSIALMN